MVALPQPLDIYLVIQLTIGIPLGCIQILIALQTPTLNSLPRSHGRRSALSKPIPTIASSPRASRWRQSATVIPSLVPRVPRLTVIRASRPVTVVSVLAAHGSSRAIVCELRSWHSPVTGHAWLLARKHRLECLRVGQTGWHAAGKKLHVRKLKPARRACLSVAIHSEVAVAGGIALGGSDVRWIKDVCIHQINLCLGISQ